MDSYVKKIHPKHALLTNVCDTRTSLAQSLICSIYIFSFSYLLLFARWYTQFYTSHFLSRLSRECEFFFGLRFFSSFFFSIQNKKKCTGSCQQVRTNRYICSVCTVCTESLCKIWNKFHFGWQSFYRRRMCHTHSNTSFFYLLKKGWSDTFNIVRVYTIVAIISIAIAINLWRSTIWWVQRCNFIFRSFRRNRSHIDDWLAEINIYIVFSAIQCILANCFPFSLSFSF